MAAPLTLARTFSRRRDRPSRDNVLAALNSAGVVTTGALTLGGLTSWGQLLLPHDLSPFANSASGWTLLTVLLLWRLRSGPALSATLAALSFVSLTVGYALVSTARGFFFDPSFWIVVGLLAGPIVGASVFFARSADALESAAGVGVLIGLIAGDGLYGVLVVSETTGWVYWVLMLAIAASALVVWSLRILDTPRAVLVQLVVAVVATALYPVAMLALGALPLL
jgi:hypothetical protein